jgi:protein O-mannosyl-transferase
MAASKRGKSAGSRVPDILAAAGLIVIATIAAYHGIGSNGFLQSNDDEVYITDNPHVQGGLSLDGVKWAFTSRHATNWHPLTWLSHMADASLFGPGAGGHHLVSLGLHIASALLLFAFLLYTTSRLWSAVFVAILFAIHPLHVESVAWAAERKDVLSAFFWFTAMLAYAWYTRRPGTLRYITVLVAMVLGLMAKPMLVTLPLVLLLLDYWPLERFTGWTATRRLLLEKVPMVVLAAASCAMTLWAQTEAIAGMSEVGFWPRMANAACSYGIYILQMFRPTGLAAFYPYPTDFASLQVRGIIVLVLLLVATAAAILLGRKRRYLAVGWLWYLVTLVPVIGIVQVGWQAHADRYTYIPLVGPFVAFAWLVADAARGSLMRRQVALAAVAPIVVVLCLRTAQQVGYWKDSMALYSHAVKATGRNALMHNNLAFLYMSSGQVDKAIEESRRSIADDPHWSEGYAMLATELIAQGKLEEATDACRRALELGPGTASAHFAMGEVMARKGDYANAISEFRAALAIGEDFAAWNDMAICLNRTGQPKLAEDAWRNAIRLRPDDAAAYVNLGALLAEQGRRAEAMTILERAVALDPGNTSVMQRLEQVKATQP